MTSSSKRPEILLVEDDSTFRRVLASELGERGFDVIEAESGEGALEQLRRRRSDVVLLDLKMPGMDGMEVLRRLREEELLDAPVIVLTGHGSIDAAVEATRLGAFHFLTKPCPLDELEALVGRALAHGRLERTQRGLDVERSRLVGDEEILGDSPAIRRMSSEIQKIAATEAAVLITGESGTGKELVARTIHSRSARRMGPFLALNCAAFQETLLESELFGYEKGAFTGATVRKPGLLETAEGGSVLLDELAEMSTSVQAKLLRVLQFGSFTRVGGTRESRLDVRILAATNRALPKAIREGTFREDLYWRLNTFEIVVPPLRERLADLRVLATAFLARRRGEGRPLELEPRTLALLESYSWPGNVRELSNLVERATILAEDSAGMHEVVRYYLATRRRDDMEKEPMLLAEVEMRHIHKVLELCGGNKTEAAKRLGISVRTLYNKLNASPEEGES